MLISLIRGILIACTILALAPPARAALIVEGTRVIYFGHHRSASIGVVNQAPQATLVQTWITNEGENAGGNVPFAVTEPLVRLPAGEHHQLHILYSGEGLPTDRESLFWLNIMEIPLKAEDPNSIQFAIRQRLKLLYRPPTLQGESSEAVQHLIWRNDDGHALTVSNPGAFNISLINLQTDSQSLSDYLLLKPSESKTLNALKPLPNGATVYFTEINDIGLQSPHSVVLK